MSVGLSAEKESKERSVLVDQINRSTIQQIFIWIKSADKESVKCECTC